MPTLYRNVKASIDSGRVALSADLQAQPGATVGYQIYDADSDTLLVEGERTPAAPNLELRIPLPQDPGRFRIFISPVSESAGWDYDKGDPFIVVEAEVAAETQRLLRCGVTTQRMLGVRRLLRSVQRACLYPLRSIWRNRSLIRSMVRRDIVGRYAGSYGGVFWTVIHPLLMMLTYWFVFGYVLKTRFGADGQDNFTLYFLAGMLPWLAFSEAAGRAPGIVLEHANFVKKLVFPLDILPVNLVFAGLFSEVFGVAIFLLGMIGFGVRPTATALYLPLILIPQILLTMGVSWFLAALGVVFRDLGQIIGFALTLLFFTTPICYPEPENLRWLFQMNPIYVLVRGYRAVLLENAAPDWSSWAALTACSAAFCLFGYAWFYKLRKQFADMV